eukprot:CAMPEP_0118656294 /NCGR_PEP_ID=MMETSP0785-20121206/13417_1 /TAXON_ID=91992 /ORGANISM="Bolidomonas pacifica, Strain CCMP 1866" /LENGTH=555 /DNA_ID=CAMNT_0006549153 /DNA_START=261 /DNA_END=1925 /DNA_ORIENTATION=+
MTSKVAKNVPTDAPSPSPSSRVDGLLATYLSSDSVYEEVLSLIDGAQAPLSEEEVALSPDSMRKRRKKAAAESSTTTIASTTISPLSPLSPPRGKTRGLDKFHRTGGLPLSPRRSSPSPTSPSATFNFPNAPGSDDIYPPTSPMDSSPNMMRGIEMPEVEDERPKESLPRFYLKDEHGKHRRRSLTYPPEEHKDEEPKDIWPSSPAAPISKEDFLSVTKDVCGFPSFFNSSFYDRVAAASEGGVVSKNTWEHYYAKYIQKEDRNTRFFHAVAKPGAQYITRDDFVPFISALLAFHAGLEFLSEHKEFQEKYAVTVITRIFYAADKTHDGRLTARMLRKSGVVEAFTKVDLEEDINKVTEFFSYEHFYVLYCRFWELDGDRDYKISRDDLLKYGDHSLSHMIVDRIFESAPRPFGNGKGKGGRDYMGYEDFIYFMLSEEDKQNEISVKYWFECLDVDGDGYLSTMDMKGFYGVQSHRMQCLGHEVVPFEDVLCQFFDMIKPTEQGRLAEGDFMQGHCNKVSGSLFDALFNLNKYLQFESRDPFLERNKREDEFDTD